VWNEKKLRKLGVEKSWGAVVKDEVVFMNDDEVVFWWHGPNESHGILGHKAKQDHPHYAPHTCAAANIFESF